MANELSFTIRVKNMVNQGIDAAKKSFASLSGWAKNAGSSMTASMLKAAAGVFAFSKAVQIAGQAVRASLQFEGMQDRFATLLGNLDDARKHMEALKAVTRESPFAFEDVAKASQELLKFSNGLLGTAANMKLIADVAGGTDRSIADVGAAVGKAFSNIKAGLPIQRVALELRELGIITGDQVVQLKEMERLGKPVADMWDLITAAMKRFNGEAAADAQLGEGIIQRMKNEWTFALKEVADGFASASTGAGNFIDTMKAGNESGVFGGIGKGAGKLISGAAATIGGVGLAFKNLGQGIGQNASYLMGNKGLSLEDQAAMDKMYLTAQSKANYEENKRLAAAAAGEEAKIRDALTQSAAQAELDQKAKIADEINDLYLRGQVEAAEAAAKRHKELAPEVSRVQALELLKARANAPRQSQMTAEAAKANLDAAQAQAQMSWQEWMDPALRAQRLEQEQKEQKFREEYQKMIPGILSRRKYFGSDQAFESTLKDREKAALQLSKDLEATEKARMNLETITKSVVVIASSLEKLLVTK